MSKIKVASLHNFVEFNLPYMFATPNLIEKKVDTNGISQALASGIDEITVNVNFPVVITKETNYPTLKLVMRVRKFRHKTTGKVIARPEIVGVVKTRFSYEDIPLPESIPDNLKDRQDFLFIKEKFEERPVWLKNSLMVACKDKIKFDSFHMFKKMLSFLAYSFKDGPWKHAYVRFGYDPRADPQAFMYQVIDVGLLETNLLTENFMQSQKRNELETYDPTFNEAPTKLRQLYQVCDIKDQTLVEIVEKERAILEKSDEIQCDKKYGWFSKKAFKSILKYMKSKFKIT